MKLQEVVQAYQEMYGDSDNTALEKLRSWWESVDFVSSDDPFTVAQEAASSSIFDLDIDE